MRTDSCLIGAKVYALDWTMPKEKHLQRALAKLTDKEKEALGIQL